MMTRARAGWLGVWWLGSLCVGGCWANRVDLDPSPLATTLPGEVEVAVAGAEGVTVLVAPDAWAGDAALRDRVTPLWVGLRNAGERPVIVRYAALRLVGRERIHAALPPIVNDADIIRLTGEGYEHADAAATAELVEGQPFRGAERFRVDPHVQPLWPELPSLAEGRRADSEQYTNASIARADELGTDPDIDAYDPVYDRGYWSEHQDWAADERPIHPLIVAALPEGVLEPGGQVEGLVYFEHVPDDLDSLFGDTPEPTLELVVDLVDARSGEPFGRLRLPFVLD